MALRINEATRDYSTASKRVSAYASETGKFFDGKGYDFIHEEIIKSPPEALQIPLVRNNRFIKCKEKQLNTKEKIRSYSFKSMVTELYTELLVYPKNKKLTKDKNEIACYVFEGISAHVSPLNGSQKYTHYKKVVLTGFILSRLNYFKSEQVFYHSKINYRSYDEYLFQNLKGALKAYSKKQSSLD